MWCQLRQTLKNTTVAQEKCHHQRTLCPKTPGEGLLLILFDLHILIHHVFRYVPQGKPLDQHHRLRVRCRENRSPRYHSWILRGAKTSSPCRSSQISLEQKSGSDYRDWRRLSISSISSSRCKLLFPLLAVVVVLKSAATATAVVSANWPASYAETNPGGLKQRMKPPSLMSFTREQTDHQILYHKLFSDHQHLKYLFASYLISFFFRPADIMGDIIIPFNIFLCQFYYHLTLATYKNDVDGVGHFSLRSMNRSTICRSCLLIVNDVVGTTVCSTADEKATGVFVQVSYGDTHSTPNDFKEACLFVDHNLKSVSVQLKKCSCWWPLFSILDWPLYRLWCSRWCCNPPFYHCCLVYWSVRHLSMLMFAKPWELESPAYHSNSPTRANGMQRPNHWWTPKWMAH